MPSIINSIANSIQNLIISAAFLMFLIAIFYYVSSGGDSKKVGKAKEYLASAVTALVALVLVKMFIKSDIIQLGAPAKSISIAVNPIGGILNAIHGTSTDAMAIFNVATTILAGITGLILEIIPIFALLMIMYAGLQYIFSAGNPKKSEEAVKLLNSAIIGFAIFLMLYALWYFILDFIGI
jgi:hypothetical protein